MLPHLSFKHNGLLKKLANTWFNFWCKEIKCKKTNREVVLMFEIKGKLYVFLIICYITGTWQYQIIPTYTDNKNVVYNIWEKRDQVPPHS